MCWGIITTIADVIVTVIAIIQAMVSCYILVLVSIIVFHFGKVLDSIDKCMSDMYEYVRIHLATKSTDRCTTLRGSCVAAPIFSPCTYSRVYNVSVVDFFMGTDLSDQINGVAGLFKFLVMSIVVGQFIICVLLCKGLCENKPWLILPYIICGGFLLGVRVRLIIMFGDLDESQKDESVRFCYGYGGYLLYLFIHCVEHVQKKKRQQKSLVHDLDNCA